VRASPLRAARLTTNAAGLPSLSSQPCSTAWVIDILRPEARVIGAAACDVSSSPELRRTRHLLSSVLQFNPQRPLAPPARTSSTRGFALTASNTISDSHIDRWGTVKICAKPVKEALGTARDLVTLA
jgi:hypothetical protein